MKRLATENKRLNETNTYLQKSIESTTNPSIEEDRHEEDTSGHTKPIHEHTDLEFERSETKICEGRARFAVPPPVSYTHLTLPTKA